MRVTREALKRYGYTDSCPGCSFVQGDITYYMCHNNECRKRVIERMISDTDADNSKRITTELIRMTIEIENKEKKTTAEETSKKAAEEEMYNRREHEK